MKDRADVRMRGFVRRSDVEDVETLLRDSLVVPPPEPIAVADCAGRVLAADVASPVDVPGFDRSAMDGYAVRGQETFGATEYDPITLEIVGESMPARPYPDAVAEGEAVRIMTGAPMPAGADAVVMVEACREEGDRVWVTDAVAPRKNVGARGEDVRLGEQVLAAGRRLRPQDAGLLAAIGVSPVSCYRLPRVEILATGDELLAAGEAPTGHRIVDSNSVMLSALVARDGGELHGCRLIADQLDDLRAALTQDVADVVLLSGASSVGAQDHAPKALADVGRLDFHGVSMRPSSPAGGGRIADRRVFLLPGNPVSCLCAYEFFAGPVIRSLGGRAWDWPHRRLLAPLARKISSQVGRTDYVRVALDEGRVVPLAISGASILSSAVRASGAVIVPRELEGYAEGERVEVLLYDAEISIEP